MLNGGYVMFERHVSYISTIPFLKDNILFSSSMLALQGGGLVHGLAVVPDQQTRGRGRGSNLWISPPGILN